MTWKDKLELGLKEDAAFRKDNLPPSQVRGEERPTGPGRSPEIPLAREDETEVPEQPEEAKTPSAPVDASQPAASAKVPSDPAKH